ncbi:MAG TPA: hypothetical protein VL494_04530 [Steroidobacteraceae bacterium]|jgi:hypothetical protein|nr:hypothetical protein [Steroidobacteraceae bacterium]
MKSTQQKLRGSALRSGLVKATALALAIASFASVQQASADPVSRAQAKRMYDRLVGTPPTPALLDDLESRVAADKVAAGLYMLDKSSPRSSQFYTTTLKNFATPWTNRDQTVFAPLNDYVATVIGMVRDDADFRTVLSADLVYIGQGISPAYSTTNNDHYVAMESNNADLRVVLQPTTQSSLNGLPPNATAGIITSRAAAEAFFIDGTNRAMFRFTLLNHLCHDMEQVHDTTRPPDRIRQDVTRSPGGDSSLFLNNCIGCHSGMDPMAQAFAYYDFDETQSKLVFTDGQVQPKYLINSDNFKSGYITTDDHWENRWRLPGKNTVLGWAGQDGTIRSGNGAKTLGEELANSDAFAECQATKVFKTVCFRSPSDQADRDQVTSSANGFKSGGNLKRVFAETAAYCAGN